MKCATARTTPPRRAAVKAQRANSAICCWWPVAAMQACLQGTPHDAPGCAKAGNACRCTCPCCSWACSRWAPGGWCATPPRPGRSGLRPPHPARLFMKNFAVKSFDATGRLQSEVMGETARHYPDTDTLEIDQARMRSVAPNGRDRGHGADRALSNADGSEVQLLATPWSRASPHQRVALALPSRAWSSGANSCTPSHRKKRCGPTAPCNSRAATTASPQTPWNTTTSTRCCNCAGVCAAC
jgi:hypothetical protein